MSLSLSQPQNPCLVQRPDLRHGSSVAFPHFQHVDSDTYTYTRLCVADRMMLVPQLCHISSFMLKKNTLLTPV